MAPLPLTGIIANKNRAVTRDAIASWPAPEIADLLLNLPKRVTTDAPLITSLSDISGVLIYFSLATWLLNLPS